MTNPGEAVRELQSRESSSTTSSRVDRCRGYLEKKTILKLAVNGSDDVEYYAEALKSNTTITDVALYVLKGVPLKSYEAVAEMILFNSTIVKLVLTDGVGDYLCIRLANALQKNKSITHLCLRNDSHRMRDHEGEVIAKDGATALANCLKTNHTLKKLDLRSDNIGNEGCVAIASALESNDASSLESLVFRDNGITKEDVFQFAKALKHNKTITELELLINTTHDNECYDAIIAALRTHNSTLTKFTTLTHYPQEKQRIIGHYLNLNKSGRKIVLSGSDATREKQVEALITARRDVDIFFHLSLLKPDLFQQSCDYAASESDIEHNKKGRKRPISSLELERSNQ